MRINHWLLSIVLIFYREISGYNLPFAEIIDIKEVLSITKSLKNKQTKIDSN